MFGLFNGYVALCEQPMRPDIEFFIFSLLKMF